MAEKQIVCLTCNTLVYVGNNPPGATISCPQCGAQLVVPPKKRSTASLVFGILGLVSLCIPLFGFAFALTSLIIGCVKKYTAGIVLGAIGIVLNLLAIPMMAVACAVLLPAMNHSLEKAHQASCQNNMKQIGHAIIMYMNDNNEKMPSAKGEDGLELLRSGYYLSDDTVYLCPSFDEKYIYIGDGIKISSIPAPSDLPMVVEAADNHTDGINVLFADGHTEFIKTDKPLREIVSDRLNESGCDSATRSRVMHNLLERYGY